MKKKIKIHDLVVNPDNFRFNPVNSENLAIDLMLEEKSSEILVLAQHIAEYGLDAAKELRVVKSADRFLVLDGNRRTTAIKCLYQPILAKNKNLEKKFLQIKEGKNLPEEINCFVYEDEKSANVWIKLDHTGKNDGAGLDKWEHDSIQRFDNKFGGKLSPAFQAFEILKKYKLLTGKEKPNFTTLDRILSTPEARPYLGVDIKKGKLLIVSDKTTSLERLKTLFDQNIKVADVYNVSDRKKFMEKNFGNKLENLEKDDDSHPSLFIEGDFANYHDETTLKEDKQNQNVKIYEKRELEFKTLINPNQKSLPVVNNKKIKEVFKELQIIEVRICPNAVCSLIRILLDITVIEFFREKKYNFGDDGSLIITDHDKYGKNKSNLKEKIDYISTKYLNSEKHLKESIKLLNENKSTKSLNLTLHNPFYSTTEKEIRDYWKNLLPFLEFLWKEIKPQ